MKSTAQTIIFAINSAIRLGRNTRQAYAKSLKSRAIVLPLPRFLTLDRDLLMAQEFFRDEDLIRGGGRFLSEVEYLQKLHDRHNDSASPNPLSEAEKDDYFDYYERFKVLVEANVSGELSVDQVSPEELAALLRIRQWESGKEPGSSPLQMVAGTLVELGIDYFNQVPGALNRRSSLGQIMSHFLAAIDAIEFADRDQMARQMERIGPLLFVAVAESAALLGEQYAADPKMQSFIGAAARGVAEDLRERLNELSPAKEDEALAWGDIILRSAVANAGAYVFSRPDRMIDDLNAGATAMIREVGDTLLGAILASDDRLDLGAGLNRENLDRMLQAAFRVFAAHPAMISGDDGFRQIVEGVSTTLSTSSFQQPGYLPEIVRLILDGTARHLPTIWNVSDAGVKNLLLAAAQETLSAFAQRDSNTWRPRLTGDQLLELLNRMIELTAANPAWVTTGLDESSLLRRLILIVIETLAAAPAKERLEGDLFLRVLDECILAVATNPALLQRLNVLDDADESYFIREVLRLVVDVSLQRTDTDPMVRRERFFSLLRFLLDAVASRYPDEKGLRIMELIATAAFPPGGKAVPQREELERLVDLALSVLEAYPEWITHDKVLAILVRQLANRLREADLHDPHWLAILVRTTLKVTANHAGLIVGDADDGPRYLAAEALADLLLAFHGENAHGAWHPHFTVERMVATGELLLDRLLERPEWLLALKGEDSAWRAVIGVVMGNLSRLPVGARIAPDVLEKLLWNALRAALGSPELLRAVHWTDDEHEKLLLSRLVDLSITFAYPNDEDNPARHTILEEVLRFTLDWLVNHYPDRRGLVLLDLTLAAYDPSLDRPFDRTEAVKLVAAFSGVIAARPDLIARSEILRNMVAELAGSLPTDQPSLLRLLPEFVRLALSITGDNIHQLLPTREGEPKMLLALALEQTLDQISQPSEGDGWYPTFSGEQLLEVVEIVFREAVRYPAWVSQGFIRVVLAAILEGIKTARLDQPLPPAIVLLLVEEGMEAIRIRPELALEFVNDAGEEQRLVLTFALKELLVTLYGKGTSPAAKWTLQQQDLVKALLVTYLTRLTTGPLEEEVIQKMIDTITEAADELVRDLDWTVDELLAQLARI